MSCSRARVSRTVVGGGRCPLAGEEHGHLRRWLPARSKALGMGDTHMVNLAGQVEGLGSVCGGCGSNLGNRCNAGLECRCDERGVLVWTLRHSSELKRRRNAVRLMRLECDQALAMGSRAWWCLAAALDLLAALQEPGWRHDERRQVQAHTVLAHRVHGRARRNYVRHLTSIRWGGGSEEKGSELAARGSRRNLGRQRLGQHSLGAAHDLPQRPNRARIQADKQNAVVAGVYGGVYASLGVHVSMDGRVCVSAEVWVWCRGSTWPVRGSAWRCRGPRARTSSGRGRRPSYTARSPRRPAHRRWRPQYWQEQGRRRADQRLKRWW